MIRSALAVLWVVFAAGCVGPRLTPIQATPFRPPVATISPFIPQNGKAWRRFRSQPPIGQAFGLTSGPDRSVWYAEVDGAIAKITVKGSMSEFPVPGYNPEALTIGADGDLYALDDYGPFIIKMSPVSGHFTVFTFTEPNVEFSNGITLGPDGNVWFLEGHAVASITQQGKITEYALATGGRTIRYGSITPGPDGDVWFDENGTVPPEIGKVDPRTGLVTEFNIEQNGLPNCKGTTGLAAGPDGAMWFYCDQEPPGFFGRIATDGTTSQGAAFFARVGLTANSIVADSDGNLWFTYFYTGTNVGIGTYDVLTGNVSSFQAPSGWQVGGDVALGPDGNIWTQQQNSWPTIFVLRTITTVPSSLTFAGPGQSQTLTVAEHDTSDWTVSSTDRSVAKSKRQSPGVYSVESTGAGNCRLIVRDAIGNSISVPVSVGSAR